MRKKKIQIKVRTIGIIIDLTRSSRRDFLSGFLNAADTGRTWNIQLIQSKETLTSKTVQNWVDGAGKRNITEIRNQCVHTEQPREAK